MTRKTLVPIVCVVLCALASGAPPRSSITAVPDLAGGSVDVEIPNRTTVLGKIDPASELETYRVFVPAGVALHARVSATKTAATFRLSVVDPHDQEVSSATSPIGVDHLDVSVATTTSTGLHRIDVHGTGGQPFAFRLVVEWTTPLSVPLSSAVGSDTRVVTFAGESGTRVRPRLTVDGVASAVAITGAAGPLSARRGSFQLPATGEYEASFDAAPAVTVDGSLELSPPKKRARVKIPAGGYFGGNRLIRRTVTSAGALIVVPALAEGQELARDISGAAANIPTGALSYAQAFSIQSGAPFEDPTHQRAPSGVPVAFTLSSGRFTGDVKVTLPFDVAAFPLGLSSLRVLSRDDHGRVVEVPPALYSFDNLRGTVSFPASHFSQYASFGPKLELALVAKASDFLSESDPVLQNIAVDRTGNVFLAAHFSVRRLNPATGAFERYLEFESGEDGGVSNNDGTPREEWIAHGTTVTTMAFDSSDRMFFAEAAFQGGEIYRVDSDDRVRRIAGRESDPILPNLMFGLVATSDGIIYARHAPLLLDNWTDSTNYPTPGVVRIDTLNGTVTRVAGGGSSRSLDGTPRDYKLRGISNLLLDASGRLITSDERRILRFDLASESVTRLAGRDDSAGPRDFDSLVREAAKGFTNEGAPLDSIRFESARGLAFDPVSEDFLYVSDTSTGLVWRLDLRRGRGFIVAGKIQTLKQRLAGVDAPVSGAIRPARSPLVFPSFIAVSDVGVFVLEAKQLTDVFFERTSDPAYFSLSTATSLFPRGRVRVVRPAK